MTWKSEQQASYSRRISGLRLAVTFFFALFFLGIFHSVASAQIILDGVMNEPAWYQLGTSAGGPPSSFGPGHEINALYAKIDSSYFYIGVAGNVQYGSRILVFIDSAPGGYTNGRFGRASAPPGINTFNQDTVFDEGFTPNYILSISTNNGQQNYFWDLYTLSGSPESGGGPNLYLGDRNDPDLRANPADRDVTRGFEARLTYSATGGGVDIAINQPRILMMAMLINDAGMVSNQFISHASHQQTGNFGKHPIFFNAEHTPDPVAFAHLLVVNEIDYIQPGANVSEFIEIKNITNIPISLGSYHLRFARGVNSPPEVYRDIALPDVIINPGGYFVVCTQPANVPNCNLPVEPPQDLLENAIPAAVALLHNKLIIDVISYGGNVGAPYSEGAGVLATDDGTQLSLGISRIMDGVDTNSNYADFGLRCITPGQPNSAQTGGCGPETPTFTPTPTTQTSTPTPTGTATATGTPTPTRHVPPKPTHHPPQPPQPPASCPNVLVNGDFESDYGWEFGKDPVPGKYTSFPVHSGGRAVQLGITPESGRTPVYSYSSIRQQVSVPPNATVQLRWWHHHRTELPELNSTNNTQDRQEVILLHPNGDTLRVLQRVRRNDAGWQQSVLDLTEYAGQTFVLYFNVINYGSGRTWTFIDDVELIVCPLGPDPRPTQHPWETPPWNPTHRPPPVFTPTPTFTPGPTTTGNTVEQDGYSLTVLRVENPSIRPSRFYQPQPGRKLVGIEVIVRNISGAPFTSNPLYAELVDTQGFLYPLAFGAIQGELQLFDVDPGEMVQGWVGFEMPHSAAPGTLRYGFNPSGPRLQINLLSIPVSLSSTDAFGAIEPFSAEQPAERVGGEQPLEAFDQQPYQQQFSVQQAGETPTATVTPTNTGEPTPTETATSTAVSFVPDASQSSYAQVLHTPQPVTPEALAALPLLPTPTIVFVADRQEIPDNCVELINNGTFEAYGVGWSREGSKILPVYATPEATTNSTQSGIAIRLGGMGEVSVAGISATQQLVQLPKDSNQITLRFRYYPLYEEPLSEGDFQYVDIYHGETGQFMGRALGVQRNDRAWIEHEYDLSAFAGESVRLFFMVSNDGIGGNIAMYLDDVSILACRVPKLRLDNRVDVALPVQTPVAATGTPQPLALANAINYDSQEEADEAAVTTPGFSFGRMAGLLTVLGIAGASLVLLPLTRRFYK